MIIQMYICLGIFLFMILGFVFADKLHTTFILFVTCGCTSFSPPRGLMPGEPGGEIT